MCFIFLLTMKISLNCYNVKNLYNKKDALFIIRSI